MKKDANRIEALIWERDHGYLSEAECARLIEMDTPPAVMVLQESAPPSSPKPPRFEEAPKMLSEGLDLSLYARFKDVPVIGRHVAPRAASAPKALTEMELIEARAALYHSAADVATHKSLPAGIHHRLAAAVRG